VDRDGSLTGIPQSIVVSSFPLMVNETAQARPEWNAHIVTEPVAMLGIICTEGDCASPTTVVRDDGATADIGIDGRFNVVMNRSYGVYRRNAACDFEINLTHEFQGDWVRISTPYTCQLDRIYREPHGVELELVEGAEAVDRDSFYFDRENSILHFMLEQPGDNSYIDNPAVYYAAVRVRGTGSNAIVLPPGTSE
jgi:hypothetical protein